MRKLTSLSLSLLLALSFLMLPTAQAQGFTKISRQVFGSAARGTTTSAVFDIGDYAGFVGYLNVTAQAGTNPTLDLKFQDAVTNAGPWFDLVAAAQITGATASVSLVPTRAPARFVRAVGTVGGTSTPTFTYTLSFIAYNAPAVTVQSTLGGAGSFTSIVATGASGETSGVRYISENITLATGGATTNSTANLLPANSLILGVTAFITTTVAGVDSTSMQIGDSTTAARFGTFGAAATLLVGATVVGITHWNGNISTTATGPTQAAAATLRLTLAGGGDNTPSAGAVRVTVAYLQFTPPTN